MMNQHGNWEPFGNLQEVTPHRLEVAEAAFEKVADQAIRSQEHLWVVIMIHRATEQLLDAVSGKATELPILDADTIAARPGIACFVCEKEFSPEERSRKCRGVPR